VSDLSKLPSKTFLMLAGLALSLVIIAAVFSLLQIWRSSTDSIEQQLVVYDRVRAIAAFKAPASGDAAGIGDGLSSNQFYANGTPAIVAAQLLSNVKQISANHGLEILRFGDVPPKVEGKLQMIGGIFDMSGPAANIYAFIDDLEKSNPILFVDSLDLHINGVSGDLNDQNSETILNLSMQIFGAMRQSTQVKE
jgi:Type II secretion system (T2SS), protein M subtype b